MISGIIKTVGKGRHNGLDGHREGQKKLKIKTKLFTSIVSESRKLNFLVKIEAITQTRPAASIKLEINRR